VLVAELDGAQRVVGVPDREAGGLDVHGQLGEQPKPATSSETCASVDRPNGAVAGDHSGQLDQSPAASAIAACEGSSLLGRG
jgi:hypothetical protein